MTMEEFMSKVTVSGDRLYLYSQTTSRLFELTVADGLQGNLAVNIARERPIGEWERQGWDRLTVREREVVSLVLQGKSYRAVSEALFISIGTVKKTAHNAYQKLGVGSRWELLHG